MINLKSIYPLLLNVVEMPRKRFLNDQYIPGVAGQTQEPVRANNPFEDCGPLHQDGGYTGGYRAEQGGYGRDNQGGYRQYQYRQYTQG